MERRAILRALSAGVVGSVIGARPGFAAEPPPETLRLRTTASKIGLCVMGPKIVAEALWRAESFTDVQYIPADKLELRLAALNVGRYGYRDDVRFLPDPENRRRHPIVILAGLHAGCFELFEYDPEDTVRFYSLRLREAGMIASTPQKILAQGTDWRILNELKKEMKG